MKVKVMLWPSVGKNGEIDMWSVFEVDKNNSPIDVKEIYGTGKTKQEAIEQFRLKRLQKTVMQQKTEIITIEL